MDQKVEKGRQKTPEVKIALRQTIRPFENFSTKSIPDNGESPAFVIPEIGKAVFKFSSKVPSATGEWAQLIGRLYVWVELSLESSLDRERVDEIKRKLTAIFLSDRAKFKGTSKTPEADTDLLVFDQFRRVQEQGGTQANQPRDLPMFIPTSTLSQQSAEFSMENDL